MSRKKPFRREVEQREVACPRCKGEGKLDQYNHVAQGRCFKCGGEGKVLAWVPKQAA